MLLSCAAITLLRAPGLTRHVVKARKEGEPDWGEAGIANQKSYKKALSSAMKYIRSLMDADRKLGPLKQLQVGHPEQHCVSSMASLCMQNRGQVMREVMPSRLLQTATCSRT